MNTPETSPNEALIKSPLILCTIEPNVDLPLDQIQQSMRERGVHMPQPVYELLKSLAGNDRVTSNSSERINLLTATTRDLTGSKNPVVTAGEIYDALISKGYGLCSINSALQFLLQFSISQLGRNEKIKIAMNPVSISSENKPVILGLSDEPTMTVDLENGRNFTGPNAISVNLYISDSETFYLADERWIFTDKSGEMKTPKN